MIHCTVDGREHAVTTGEMDELAALIDALSSELGKEGRFIASLTADGRELYPCSEWYRPRNLQGIRRLEVTTGLSVQLATDALAESDRCLDELRSTLLHSVECFRAGNDQRGINLFIDLVTRLEWFVTTVKSVGDVMQIDFTATLMDGTPLAAEIEGLNQILLDIVGAQERRDWVLLGDLLEYELEPQLERCRELLGVLRQISAT
jgi:hypothetical protein